MVEHRYCDICGKQFIAASDFDREFCDECRRRWFGLRTAPGEVPQTDGDMERISAYNPQQEASMETYGATYRVTFSDGSTGFHGLTFPAKNEGDALVEARTQMGILAAQGYSPLHLPNEYIAPGEIKHLLITRIFEAAKQGLQAAVADEERKAKGWRVFNVADEERKAKG